MLFEAPKEEYKRNENDKTNTTPTTHKAELQQNNICKPEKYNDSLYFSLQFKSEQDLETQVKLMYM